MKSFLMMLTVLAAVYIGKLMKASDNILIIGAIMVCATYVVDLLVEINKKLDN